ncbi:MAG: hypothetical protein QM736_16770 [Vicinamibacterales bacterium]
MIASWEVGEGLECAAGCQRSEARRIDEGHTFRKMCRWVLDQHSHDPLLVAGIVSFGHDVIDLIDWHRQHATSSVRDFDTRLRTAPNTRGKGRDGKNPGGQDWLADQSVEQRRFSTAHPSDDANLKALVEDAVDEGGKAHSQVDEAMIGHDARQFTDVRCERVGTRQGCRARQQCFGRATCQKGFDVVYQRLHRGDDAAQGLVGLRRDVPVTSEVLATHLFEGVVDEGEGCNERAHGWNAWWRGRDIERRHRGRELLLETLQIIARAALLRRRQRIAIFRKRIRPYRRVKNRFALAQQIGGDTAVQPECSVRGSR